MKKLIEQNHKGFTMLELLMVIIVVGLLASLAIPKFSSMAERARVAEVCQVVNMVNTGENMFFLENTSYVSSMDITNFPKVCKLPTSKYWNYTVWAVVNAGSQYAVQATRNGFQATSDCAGKSIIYTFYNATRSGVWSGDHPNVPS